MNTFTLMNRLITLLAALLSTTPSLLAKEVAALQPDPVENASVERDGSRLNVSFSLPLEGTKVRSRQAVTFTPVITDGTDSVALPKVALYGRDRWIHYRRDLGEAMLAGDSGTNIRAWEAPDSLLYSSFTEWQDWMQGAALIVERKDYGCCSTLLAEGSTPALLNLLPPEENVTLDFDFAFVAPVAETVKSRSAEGKAFIDFPVNKTVIYPDYRGNQTELAKIIATIDSINNDRDITVKSISIKGFASPEGSWANNTRLAKGRTEALKDYVRQLRHFPEGFIATAYEPEDWDGLRAWLEKCGLENRNAILDIVDSQLEPDAKDARIRKLYPKDYAFILKNVYPALRHSDYRIDYEVRSFSDIEEIKRLVKTQPQKLSLNEFYLAAQSYPVGSDEFNEVFETAVRMYPSDEIANLNAANTAIGRNDFTSAEKYLRKAGDSGNTEYLWGLLEIRRGNYEKALAHMETAAKLKVANAPMAVEKLRKKLKKD